MIRHRHFNISSQGWGPLAAVACAPGVGVLLPPSSGSVRSDARLAGEENPVGANGNGVGQGGLVFSDPVMILIRAVALYESVAPEQLIADLVAAKAEGIGLSVLARAVLEFEDRNTPSAVTDGRGEKSEGCSGDAALPASRDPP